MAADLNFFNEENDVIYCEVSRDSMKALTCIYANVYIYVYTHIQYLLLSQSVFLLL